MKKYIFALVCVLFIGVGVARADEIVLENGRIYSGNVLDLTETTVSILVDGQKVEISRNKVQAVFLGEQTPFSSYGYPGMEAMNRSPQSIPQPGSQNNAKEDK